MQATLRLDELGSVQFARLCQEVVGTEALASPAVAPWGFTATIHEGLASLGGRRLAGPALVLAMWQRNGSRSARAGKRVQRIVRDLVASAPTRPASVLLVTNVVARPELEGTELEVLGPEALATLVAERPLLRYRLPFLLGVSELSSLLPEEVRRASSGDVDAAAALARVFVPTRAYARALAVLERYGFVVLSGPPEMGKTAIARVVGLAALSDGWEVHECVRPDELWQRFREDRRQLFIADDAFGSTEYRPETAERWALELDRVLRALDDRHRLIWTSRPTPLHAALRRIHREHGVERFPQPAHVAVDATELDVGEKALMLFRHTKARAAPGVQVAIVRTYGWEIVSHPHLTPERIRRFCSGRLAELVGTDDIVGAVTAEIREPTTGMAASYHALTSEQKAVLHALVDTPPGAVTERELHHALRRHAAQGLTQPLTQITDQLADHFLRVGANSIAWVHPSWRDLVIDELAADGHARLAFLCDCRVHGIALALSTAGGSGGERTLPLLRKDADWDALADRIGSLLPTLEIPELTLLLQTLAEAVDRAPRRSRTELDALARETLAQLGRMWDSAFASVVPVGLLATWLSLAEHLRDPPPVPERALAKAWLELLPSNRVDVTKPVDVAAFDEWLLLTDLLAAVASETLDRLGFPHRQTDAVRAIVEDVAARGADLPAETRTLLLRALARIARLLPAVGPEARQALSALASQDALQEQHEPEPQLREPSPELRLALREPLPSTRHEQLIVARVLQDL